MLTKTHKAVAAFIFSLILTLIVDNNAFVATPQKLVVFGKKVERSSGAKGHERGHNTFFIIDQNGGKYKVPGYVYVFHDLSDTFSVTRSFFFKKAIRFQSDKDGVYIDEKIGVLNSDWFSRIISLLPLLLSFVVLFFDRMIKDEDRRIVLLYVSALLSAVTVAFYFIFST